MAIEAETSLTIRVRGQVQGVGYRPFVWQLARRLGLRGDVSNDAQGVLIHVAGPDQALGQFVRALAGEAPPLAHVAGVEPAPGAPVAASDFTITESHGGHSRTGITADAATCPACLAEVRDPAERRNGYAFTNCTHCGPRLTIVEAVPYDRANTSMKAFPMCEACAAEYRDPADRRFHAQPIACPDCGPRLWLEGGNEGDPIAGTARLLRAGKIVAIKGLGGFHLACIARDAGAVAELRRRKARDAKPLALMVASVEQARSICDVTDEAAALLSSSAAPIVLLPWTDRLLPRALAPDQDHLGVMLAYTPLHHLLLDAIGEPLVMTSGNRSDEPQAIANAEARERLAGLADFWLMHDREIVNRVDDSVMALDARGPMVLRRARGMAPDPVTLPEGLASDVPILAMGGELKATFCLLRGREAVLSQHIGDLEDAAALADYRRMLDLFGQLYDFTPELIAVDAHPDYLSTRLGRRMGAELGVPVVAVAHHHAHMAACLAEHGVAPGEEALALACDGLGLGTEGTLWGGEVLRGSYASVERIAALPAVALPGGARAMRQPWRNLVAHLMHAFGPDWREVAAPLTAHLPDAESVSVIEQAIARGLNSPRCSSAGRLFDAVAAALGVHPLSIGHEGQAAMALECLARRHMAACEGYPLDAPEAGDVARASLGGLWRGIAGDVAQGTDPGVIAARFHHSFSDIMAALPGDAAPGTRIALSGGTFQNRVVREGMAARLEARGLVPLVHHKVPAGDGGLSLGQSAVAAALAASLPWGALVNSRMNH
ncbi:MAG: carbamoyltransferase HypF [Sphingomonadales bacterium]|nr:carbamoyltransferase HypF [Sphingomonadales bacterium]MDE2568407.1 carbamoyltransferase HypF [Sphingomonadales bacterium]